MNIPDTNEYDSKAIEIVRVLDQYMAELKAGGAPGREELLVPFPLSEFRAVVKPPLAAYVIAATA